MLMEKTDIDWFYCYGKNLCYKVFFGVEGMIRNFFKGRSLLGDRFKFFLFATFYFVFYLGICLYFLLSGSVSFVDFVDEFS